MKLFLSSYDYGDFEKSRRILEYQKIKIGEQDALEIEVDQPLIGQKYGLLDMDPTTFYLISRQYGVSVHSLNKFPISVFVLIVKNKKVVNPTSLADLQNIAWAYLYDNEKDAINRR